MTAQVAQILSLIDLRFVHNDTAAVLVLLRPVRSRMKLQSGKIPRHGPGMLPVPVSLVDGLIRL